jgi:hypothetical protein
VREPHRQCAAYSPPMAGFSTGRRPCRNLPNSSSTPGQTSGDGSVGGGGGWARGAGGGSGGGSGSGGAGGRSGGGSGSRGRRWRRWWRRWPRAATSADATSAHRSTVRPTSAAACRPYGARRDHPGAYRWSSSGRGSGADAAPAAHPTYAGTHSAKSSAVAYSRLINPRRGPTGSAEETEPASSSATTTGRSKCKKVSRSGKSIYGSRFKSHQ